MIKLNDLEIKNLEGARYEMLVEKSCRGFYDIYIGDSYIGFAEKIKSKWWLKLDCKEFISSGALARFNESDKSFFKTLSDALDYVQEDFSNCYCDFGNKLN